MSKNKKIAILNNIKLNRFYKITQEVNIMLLTSLGKEDELLGSQKEKDILAKNLLKMELPSDFISDATGVTMEELEALKTQN